MGEFLPSLAPAKSDCLRFVSGPSGVDELMTVYPTPTGHQSEFGLIGSRGASSRRANEQDGQVTRTSANPTYVKLKEDQMQHVLSTGGDMRCITE